ncbi:hypothetical protein [Brevibacillus migulae]|uniref:hypothetical protein n=1 Tax=Brevibacillus migulae TaxID=1644114 RepID=UPI00106EF403|nr:hypothetical protein [Brevibacillus migulae]
MLSIMEKHPSGFRALLASLVFFTLFTMLVPSLAFAEEVSVPVELKVTPVKKQYYPSEEIQIEAVTKKQGKTFEASLAIVFEGEDGEEKHPITLETAKKGMNYVSKAVFIPEDFDISIHHVSIQYNIVMKDNDKVWAGNAEKRIRVDNLPPVTPTVESEFSIYPEKSLKVDQKMKFTVHTPYMGTVEKAAEFKFLSLNSVDVTQKVQKIKTTYDRKKNMYMTTGYFTPKIEGEYTPYFVMLMRDKETGEIIEATGYITFSVAADPQIQASISPQKATVRLGDTIYLLLTYKGTGIKSDQFTRSYNQEVTEISNEYNEKEGTHSVLIKFKPDKKKTYPFEAKVKNPETGAEAIAKTSITVR